MTARAMWKASLDLGGEQVPVKLYAAVQDRNVHFRLLHARDRQPVAQRMVDPRSGNEVPSDAIQRAVAVEPGVFVVLSPAELESEAPEPSRAIEVIRFVPPSALSSGWYSRPYYLGPDGSGAAYSALVAALAAADLRGIARWTMRGRRYFGALEAREDHLALIAMRSADEMVATSAVGAPETKVASAAEISLAEQLVAALDAEFDPRELRDEYREKLLAFLAAKARGRRTPAPRESAPKPSTDLARALKQSLGVAKRRDGKQRRAA